MTAGNPGGYRPKYKKEAPAKLSLWQRFLGIFGIRPAKGKPAVKDKNPAKTNTRVARPKQERVATPKPARLQPQAVRGQPFLRSYGKRP